MSDFERLDNVWEQAEQSRHAALLRQLKAEVREFRRQARTSVAPLATYAQRAAVSTRSRFGQAGALLTVPCGLSLADPERDRYAITQT
jgi:hypothetical protein